MSVTLKSHRMSASAAMNPKSSVFNLAKRQFLDVDLTVWELELHLALNFSLPLLILQFGEKRHDNLGMVGPGYHAKVCPKHSRIPTRVNIGQSRSDENVLHQK